MDEYFRLQEARLLLEGEDKTGRLHEYHDQIEILRGATLNGGILFGLLCSGICVLYGERRGWHRLGARLPAMGTLLFGIAELIWHLGRHARWFASHGDPPLAEVALILLGFAGLLVQPDKEDWRLFRNGLMVAIALTVTAYGAWWWTEVLYDQQVIHSIPRNNGTVVQRSAYCSKSAS